MSHSISSTQANNVKVNDASLDDIKSTLKTIAKRNNFSDSDAAALVEKLAEDGFISVEEAHDNFKSFDINGDGQYNRFDAEFWRANLKKDIQSFSRSLKFFSNVSLFTKFTPVSAESRKPEESPASGADMSPDFSKKTEDEVSSN
jgi:hypothetical protein